MERRREPHRAELSYVKGFAPWGWVIGTGIYLEDVRAQVSDITRRVIQIALGFSILIAGLLVYMTKQSLESRATAVVRGIGVAESEEKYRMLAEGTTEGIVLAMQGRFVSRQQHHAHHARVRGRRAGRPRARTRVRPGARVPRSEPAASAPGQRVQAIRKDGARLDVLVGASPVAVGDRTGRILSVRDMTAHKTDRRDAVPPARRDADHAAVADASRHRVPPDDGRLRAGHDDSDAAAAMTRAGTSAVLVQGPSGDDIGIVTDEDLRTRVVAAGGDTARAVAGIMSAPLIRIQGDALLFEAARLMRDRDVQHLVVTDAPRIDAGHADGQGSAAGAAALGVDAPGRDPRGDLRGRAAGEPGEAAVPGEVARRRRHEGRACHPHHDHGLGRRARPPDRHERGGDGPAAGGVRAAFIVLGSEARGEQTLKTDQDNGIIYDDGPPEEADHSSTSSTSGRRVCDGLDAAGYARCKGDVMASNPKWCKPLSRGASTSPSACRPPTTRCSPT